MMAACGHQEAMEGKGEGEGGGRGEGGEGKGEWENKPSHFFVCVKYVSMHLTSSSSRV